MSEEGVYIP